MKRILFTLSVVVWTASTAQRALAQDDGPKPALVVSISSYDKLLANLNAVGEVAQRRDYPDKFAELVGTLTDTEPIPLANLPGVEKGKPWGIVAMNEGGSLRTVAFIPTTSVEEFLDGISPLVGEKKALDDGTYEIEGIKLPLLPVTIGTFVTSKDGWTFFGQSKSDLENLPDPETVLGDLPSKYDLGIYIDMKNVPDSVREFSLADMPIPLPGMGPLGQTDGQAAGGVAAALQQFQDKMSRQMQDDLSTVTIGMTLDTSAKKLDVDALLVAQPDSPTAKQFQAMKGAQTRFSELTKNDDAMMAFNLTGPLPDWHAEDLRSILQSYRESVTNTIDQSDELLSDEERSIFHELSNGLIDVLDGTAEDGKLDVALRARLFDGYLHMVAGVHIKDGAKMAELVRKFVEYAKDDPGFQSATLDVAEHNGAAIHAIAFRAPKKVKGAKPDIVDDFIGMFQDRTAYVAVTDDAAWVAMGPKAIDELKTAMDAPAEDAKPVQVRARMGYWFSLLIPQAPEAMRVPMSLVMAPSLQKHGDDLIMTAEPTDEGLRVRANVDTGYINVGRILLGFLPNIMEGGFGGGS